jgi:hypothetical protein
LTVPKRAFITFEHQITAEMAQDMEFKLFEDEMDGDGEVLVEADKL